MRELIPRMVDYQVKSEGCVFPQINDSINLYYNEKAYLILFTDDLSPRLFL